MIHLHRTGRRKLESLTGAFLARLLPKGDENPRNRFFVYSVMIIILLLAFSVANYSSKESVRTLAAALAAVGQIVSLVVLRYGLHPQIAYRICLFSLLGYFLVLMGFGGPLGARVCWMLVFPVYAFLLLGGRESMFWIAAGFIGSLCALANPDDALATFSDANNRFLLTYGALGVVAGAFEMVVYRTQEHIARVKTEQLEVMVRRLSTEIEERKRVDAALLISEERFRTFSEASFEGIALTDLGFFVDLNDQLARMLGYERSELIGKPIAQCVVAEDRELVQTAIRSGDKGPYEHLALRKDGSVLMVEAQAGTGEVGGRVMRTTALRDISARKKAESEMREAKEYAEAILDSLPGTFFAFDEGLGLTRWNKNFEMVTGYPTEELFKKHPLDLIAEEDRGMVAETIERSIATGSESVEAHALTKTGSKIPYLFTAVWHTLGDQRYLLGTGADLSDRKRAEELLLRSEKLFRTVFETAPDAVSISKMERGIFVDVNRSFSDLLGFSRDELIGKSALDLDIWADAPSRDKIVKALSENGFVQNAEASFRCKDGTVKQGLLSASALILDGEAHFLAMVKDITALKNAEAEALRLERQMRHAQKLESLGILAGGIAHDFNNILTSILGNADLGLMRVSPLASARGNLEEIRKGALRAAGLANQMLAYSGRGKFELRAIDLSQLVKEMAQLLDVATSKKAVLTLDLADGLPLIEGDVNQLQQIVMNLITNASESLGDESGFIRLSTASACCDRAYLDAMRDGAQSICDEPLAEGVYVSLEVSDSGCGMDPETQNKVFDPFFTTKFSGRGLGLAAVLGIVGGHKGIVRIYSEVGRGTTFKVLFPSTKSMGMSLTSKADDQHVLELWHGTVVLLADDEEIIRNVVKEMLEEMGMSVLTATDGNQAVDVFRENVDKISWVLLDLTMPGLDGAQTFCEMQRISPDVKVILSSGYNEYDVTQQFAGRGLAGFIQKPYTVAKLREKLNEIYRKGCEQHPCQGE